MKEVIMQPTLPPPTYIEVETSEERIDLKFHEKVDREKSQILINGKEWDQDWIDIHLSQTFELEFLLKDKQDQLLEHGVQTITGDRSAPQLILPVQDYLYINRSTSLPYSILDTDLKECAIYIDDVLYENDELIVEPEMKTVRWHLKDQAGNESSKILEIRPLIFPDYEQTGNNISITQQEDLEILKNGNPIKEETTTLENGINSFTLRSKHLLEEVEWINLSYDPIPLDASIDWENDRLFLQTSQTPRSFQVKINERVYSDMLSIPLPATTESQEFDIQIEMIDMDGNTWTSSQRLFILPLEQRPTIPEPIVQETPQSEYLPIVKEDSIEKPKIAPLVLTPPSVQKPKIPQKLLEIPNKTEPKQGILFFDQKMERIEDGDGAKTLRVRLPYKEGKEIKNVKWNDQVIQKEDIQYDTINSPYIEVKAKKAKNTIKVTYDDDKTTEVVSKNLILRKPTWKEQVQAAFESFFTWFRTWINWGK